MKVKARVYVNDDGNRFLIPGHWYSDDDPKIGMGSATNVICDSFMWGGICKLKADDWIDIDAGEDGHGTIEHYEYHVTVTGPQFTHGRITVMLIGGPLFDKEHAKAIRLGHIAA